ncbi:MAG TPA: hypothetical protein VEE86_01190 [Thermoplasmata archaeon]|nr:hypothetical protein [Thermoplasmata archaeon]
MPSLRSPDLERHDADLDDAVERFDRFAAGLVRLEPFSLEEVRRSVGTFVGRVERHLREHGGGGPPPSGEPRPRQPVRRGPDLGLEHERFRSSIVELSAYLAVVERDDHGGHRQALGQYGRIFAEALRLHRGDERAETARTGRASPPPPEAGSLSNHN